MNATDTTRLIDRLKAAYNKRIPEDTYSIWCEELGPLDFPPAWSAVTDLIHTSKYFPAISELHVGYAKHAHNQAAHVERIQCPHCENGYQFVGENTNDVRPCPHCRAEQHGYWQRGVIPPTDHPPTHTLFEPKDRVGPDAIDDIPGRVARLKALLEDRP